MRRGKRKQRGAALVEFALVSPLLVLILFGVVESAWTFSQILDMQHGAREGARLAAINYQPTTALGATQTTEIVAEVCRRLEDPNSGRVSLELDSTGDPSALATIRVERDLEQLTGFFGFLDAFVPSSDVEFRLERRVTWTSTASLQTCPAP